MFLELIEKKSQDYTPTPPDEHQALLNKLVLDVPTSLWTFEVEGCILHWNGWHVRIDWEDKKVYVVPPNNLINQSSALPFELKDRPYQEIRSTTPTLHRLKLLLQREIEQRQLDASRQFLPELDKEKVQGPKAPPPPPNVAWDSTINRRV